MTLNDSLFKFIVVKLLYSRAGVLKHESKNDKPDIHPVGQGLGERHINKIQAVGGHLSNAFGFRT